MTSNTLGRLTRVDLRDIWTSEASEFTPWLAREENLAVLAETLGIDSELEAKEKAVGPFRADMSGSSGWTSASMISTVACGRSSTAWPSSRACAKRLQA